jgi:hypothetical protein
MRESNNMHLQQVMVVALAAVMVVGVVIIAPSPSQPLWQ